MMIIIIITIMANFFSVVKNCAGYSTWQNSACLQAMAEGGFIKG